MAIGRYNVATGTPGSWIATEPVFAIGNGTSPTARSNAMTVYKNGNMDLSGNFSATGNIYTNGLLTVGGTYLRLSDNPGTGTTPVAYCYQGSVGSTAKQYAFTINDALWVTGPSVYDSYLNIDVSGSPSLYVAGAEALWYNGTYFSYGYGGTYNYFGDKVTIGNSASSGYMLYVQGRLIPQEAGPVRMQGGRRILRRYIIPCLVYLSFRDISITGVMKNILI